MKLVEFVPPVKHPLWKLCLQMGITDVIVKVNPVLTGLSDPWKYETLKKIVDGLKSEGLTVVGLEGDPFDMTPVKQYGERTLLSVQERGDHGERTLLSVQDGAGGTDKSVRSPTVGANGQECPFSEQGVRTDKSVRSPEAERELALARYRELLESMSRLGIKLLCYNFMVGPGWSRTGVREGRGGAKATYFSLAETHGERTLLSVRGAGDYGERTLLSVQDGAGGTDKSVRSPTVGANGQECPFSEQGVRTDKSVRSPSESLRLTKEQVWANYEYFIKAVMPTAEACGVRMGLHPDDPCLPSLGGYARIFETVADYDRAYAIYPCASNAVTYCQANFKLMSPYGERTLLSVHGAGGTDKSVRSPTVGANGQECPFSEQGVRTDRSVRSPGDATQWLIDTAKHFGKRIAFVHVRDVEGDRTDFTELFHDQGTTDQFALMRTYREIGLDVPVRGDHVPEMEGDRRIVEDCIPGYYTLGRLFANGYLRALLKGTEK